MHQVVCGDVTDWAAAYDGPPFHALLIDPPYHLESIARRFGKPSAKPARGALYARVGRGFMGQAWDGGDWAFRPSTWKLLTRHLYPGGFVLAFASPRNDWLMAHAMHRAGLVLHPKVFLWAYAQGVPKATRLDKRLQAMNEGPLAQSVRDNHFYGLQVLKPQAETILVAQKPYRGRPLLNILHTGAGTFNIGATRLGERGKKWSQARGGFWQTDAEAQAELETNPLGRWPGNLLLCHLPDCLSLGWASVAGRTLNRWTDGAKPFGNGAGHPYESLDTPDDWIEVWRCAAGCPVAALDEQAGPLASGKMSAGTKRSTDGGYNGAQPEVANERDTYGDASSASRFFKTCDWSYETFERLNESPAVHYSAKASVAEREHGLSHFPAQWLSDGRPTPIDNQFQRGQTHKRNPHPSVKPIGLTRWLAALLLPPPLYERRLLVPCCGVGSEMIGGLLAGWDEIVGIDLSPEYVKVAHARLDWWSAQPRSQWDAPAASDAPTQLEMFGA